MTGRTEQMRPRKGLIPAVIVIVVVILLFLGYNMFRFPARLSSGSTLEMSVFTEQVDLEAVMEMIRGLDYVNSLELFLIGTSQDGARE